MDDSFRKYGQGGWSRAGMARAVDEVGKVMRGLEEQGLGGTCVCSQLPHLLSTLALSSGVQPSLSNHILDSNSGCLSDMFMLES